MVCVAMAAMGAHGRERINMDEGWRFSLGHAADPAKDFNFGMGKPLAKANEAEGAVRPDFDDGTWRELDLPHDWAVELPFDFSDDPNQMGHGYKPVGWKYPGNSIGWYRKAFDLPASCVA
jgi:beta-galactosidase